MNTKPIAQLHAEHKEWMSKLDFYSDEITVMKSRISEVASKNNGKDILAQVEHFQNQCILQKENIDILKHEIKKHESALEANINANPTASDHRSVENHPQHSEDVNSFEKIFNELRHEFNNFLSKTM